MTKLVKTKNEDNETEVARPSFLSDEKFNAKDMDFDLSDIKMSELALAQKSSDSVDDGDAEPGEYVDSVTRANYGNKVDIIVLRQEKSWLFFEKKKLKKKSEDGKFWDDGTALTEKEEWFNLYLTFYVLVRDDLQHFPMFLSFSRTSYKQGKNLSNLIYRFSVSTNDPIYARYYTIGSGIEEGEEGKYFVKTTAPGAYVSEDEFRFAKEVYKRIENVNLEKEEKNSEQGTQEEEDTQDLD